MNSIFSAKSCLYTILFAVVTLAFASCKDDDSAIGTGIMPSSDMMEFKCDTMGAETYVVRDSMVETQNRTINPIGIINDPIFGQTTASCIFQTLLSTNNVQFSKEIDTTDLSGVSLELRLKYASKYGDSQSAMTINVNRLLTDIYYDSTYHENMAMDASKYELLVSQNLTFGSDSIIKIEMPASFTRELITQNAKKTNWNNTEFLKFLKGFYITTELTSGDGCIYALNLIGNDSKMILKYNDTCTFAFNINEYSTRVNLYSHDYTNADSELKEAMSNPETPTKYCYIQGLAGLKTKIKFPEIKTMFDSTNIIINRAQLTVRIKDGSLSEAIPNPKAISMTKIMDSGLFDFIDDYKSNSKYFGGTYNDADNSYTFNIPLHLQNLQNGENDNGVFMVANDNRITPYRAMLYGGGIDTNSIKIIVYYSKY